MSDENGYLSEKNLSKVVREVWFLLMAYGKTQEERDELKKKKMLSKKESELKDLENSPSVHAAKKKKVRKLLGRGYQKCGWTIT